MELSSEADVLQLHMFDVVTPDALPDPIPKGSVSPAGTPVTFNADSQLYISIVASLQQLCRIYSSNQSQLLCPKLSPDWLPRVMFNALM